MGAPSAISRCSTLGPSVWQADGRLTGALFKMLRPPSPDSCFGTPRRTTTPPYRRRRPHRKHKYQLALRRASASCTHRTAARHDDAVVGRRAEPALYACRERRMRPRLHLWLHGLAEPESHTLSPRLACRHVRFGPFAGRRWTGCWLTRTADGRSPTRPTRPSTRLSACSTTT